MTIINHHVERLLRRAASYFGAFEVVPSSNWSPAASSRYIAVVMERRLKVQLGILDFEVRNIQRAYTLPSTFIAE